MADDLESPSANGRTPPGERSGSAILTISVRTGGGGDVRGEWDDVSGSDGSDVRGYPITSVVMLMTSQKDVKYDDV